MDAPKLTVIKGISPETYSIPLGSVSIGRGLSNDFRIIAEGVSRSHARIVREGDDYFLIDLGSTNGTFLNGRKIAVQARLRHGDTIELGRTVGLRFEMAESRFQETDVSELVDISNELNPSIRSSMESGGGGSEPDFVEERARTDVNFLKRAYERLAILYEVNSSVSSASSLDEILERIANIVLTLEKADRVAILLVDEGKTELRPVVLRDKNTEGPLKRVQISRTIVEKTVREGVGVLSADALSDPRFSSAKSIEIQNVRSVICVPLKRKQKVIGAIYVDCLLVPDGFDEEDLRLMMAVCNEASIVVENASSYREIENLNRSLEEKVRLRTEELEKALAELKSAQSHIVQSEKMAAVGQLVAGVAHEINNPLNYVLNGIESLSRYVGELRAINSKYAEVSRHAGADLGAVEELAQSLNFDEHMELLDDLLAAISEGANRAAEIVEGLRSFSRTGEAEIKEIDLNDTIEKSLKLLSYRLKGRVEVSWQRREIPPIRCYASQMGQVFLNLLNNAQQAIGAEGTIWIKTWSDAGRVFISIADSGQGIEPEVVGKIFDPFFSTKPEGEGVGLGLSISLAIVKHHRGDIKVSSRRGGGSTFTVSLPCGGIDP